MLRTTQRQVTNYPILLKKQSVQYSIRLRDRSRMPVNQKCHVITSSRITRKITVYVYKHGHIELQLSFILHTFCVRCVTDNHYKTKCLFNMWLFVFTFLICFSSSFPYTVPLSSEKTSVHSVLLISVFSFFSLSSSNCILYYRVFPSVCAAILCFFLKKKVETVQCWFVLSYFSSILFFNRTTRF